MTRASVRWGRNARDSGGKPSAAQPASHSEAIRASQSEFVKPTQMTFGLRGDGNAPTPRRCSVASDGDATAERTWFTRSGMPAAGVEPRNFTVTCRSSGATVRTVRPNRLRSAIRSEIAAKHGIRTAQKHRSGSLMRRLPDVEVALIDPTIIGVTSPGGKPRGLRKSAAVVSLIGSNNRGTYRDGKCCGDRRVKRGSPRHLVPNLGLAVGRRGSVATPGWVC